MEKRLFLSIILSIAFLVAWRFMITNVYHLDNKKVTVKNDFREIKQGVLDATAVTTSRPISVVQEDIKLAEIETNKLAIKFDNPGARLTGIYIKDYRLQFTVNGCLYSNLYRNNIYTFKKSEESCEFICELEGHSITKRLVFSANSYVIDAEIIYQNKTAEAWIFDDDTVICTVSSKTNPAESRLYEVIFLNPETSLRKSLLQIKDRYVATDAFEALGFRDRYSCFIIKPTLNTRNNIFYVEKKDNLYDIGINQKGMAIPANSQLVYRYTIYCGPQDVNLLKKTGLGFERVVNFGSNIIDFISNILLSVLRFFYKLSHNWGLALILLSVFVFLTLYPLTLKQMHAMKQMQLIQPQVEALRKSYKDNPQRLNKEILELYKKHNANPLGGCLPMILQIPIFFGLYQALSRSIELKGSSFLWIKDLAEPDRLFQLPVELPFIGRYFNLLPILMAGAMFFQQKLSSTTGGAAVSESMAEQQKMMLVLFPILFGFIFYNFPSGLALYWFLNTLFSVITQWKNIKTLKSKTQT